MKALLKINIIIITLLSVCGLVSCIEDDFTTSPSDQPTFSVDTLNLGVIFTEEPSPTSRFTVYNRHSKMLSISSIGLSGENAGCFRLNVDGISGDDFKNVEIRGKDSIYIFVEATLPRNGQNTPLKVDAKIDFQTNGVGQSVVVEADGQNVTRLEALTITDDTKFSADIPYQIFDSLVVAPNVTLTLPAGAMLCFHDKASLIVRGTLLSEGCSENPVVMSGDRMGDVITDVSFDIMSRQWEGVVFTPTSRDNKLSHTVIKNTVSGVAVVARELQASTDVLSAPNRVNEQPVLSLHNCKLRNSGGRVLEAVHANIHAVGCEFAEAASGLVLLQGGKHVFNHCTFANYYLFSSLGGPAIQLAHLSEDEKEETDNADLPYISADFTNCIIYGNGAEISHGDLSGTDVTLRRCLLKSKGEDDENFQWCIWGEDPLYYTIREEYIFDYRLRRESPAIAAANPELTLPEASLDYYGLPRGLTPDLGAYVYVEPEDDEK